MVHDARGCRLKMAYSSLSANIHDIRSLQAGSFDKIHVGIPPITEEHARLLTCIGREWGIEVVVHRNNPDELVKGSLAK